MRYEVTYIYVQQKQCYSIPYSRIINLGTVIDKHNDVMIYHDVMIHHDVIILVDNRVMFHFTENAFH